LNRLLPFPKFISDTCFSVQYTRIVFFICTSTQISAAWHEAQSAVSIFTQIQQGMPWFGDNIAHGRRRWFRYLPLRSRPKGIWHCLEQQSLFGFWSILFSNRKYVSNINMPQLNWQTRYSNCFQIVLVLLLTDSHVCTSATG